MNVLIQVAAGSSERRIYNEKTLEFLGTRVGKESYPYPYGFILNTHAADGDNLDCYILTQQPVLAGSTVVCDPIGVLEQMENDEVDYKVIGVIRGAEEGIDESAAIGELRAFIVRIFQSYPTMNVGVERYLDRQAAEALLATSTRAGCS